MASRIADISSLSLTRTAGVLFIILVICGPFSMMYVPETIIEPEDATATANNIIASETLLRLGILSDAIIFLSEIIMIVVLYMLFKPISKTLSLISAFSRLAMTVVQGFNLFNYFIPLLLLSGVGYLNVFEPGQLHALALLFLNAHGNVAYIWEAFFSLHCLVLGYLIFKSGYFPKLLGILMVFASFGYMLDSFGNFLFPLHKDFYTSIVGFAGFFGEAPFYFWLIFKGVNIEQWNKRVL